MTPDAPSPAELHELLERSYRKIRELKRRLAGNGAGSPEPIAILGIGCRFPGGADDPDSFWRLLEEGADAVREAPPGRGGVLGRGGFLEGIDLFDAEFFGLSPREAARTDPQQRLFLEVAWEALEDAAVAPDRLAGSRTGVFAGVSNSDYARLQTADREAIDAWVGPGSAGSIVANRVSFHLGLEGPSLAIDTACSSSLVAVHLAARSLRSRECDLALAGGVNLILSPEATIAFSKARMMAPDGRCKTFDASADGYVRGEGCGIVVLARLSDSLSSGRRVRAVLRGTAVNQDGATTGLTAPSGLAQRAVIHAALADGEVEPGLVGYVEAHGTGTPLGDPIEVDALAECYGAPSLAAPVLALGSVKTNLGHLEAAAGIAGLVKAVLALERGRIPPHLHFRELNPHIRLAGTRLAIADRGLDWPRGPSPRLAAVSSFGFGGTNAHAVLEEAPAPAAPPAPGRSEHLLVLSARTAPALRELARRTAERLVEPGGPDLADLCATAATGRAALEHRLYAVASSKAELASRLLEANPARARESDEVESLEDEDLDELGRRFVAGARIDWDSVDPRRPRPRACLPTYPWQKRRHWFDRAAPIPTWGIEWKRTARAAAAPREIRVYRADLAEIPAEAHAEAVLELVAGEGPPLWIVTRGAVEAGGVSPDPEQAALWGLGRTIALERPAAWGGLLDLDPARPAPGVEAAISLAGEEDQIALRGEERFVPRLGPVAIPQSGPAGLDPAGVHLVTGGTGALGLVLARWLAGRGARRIVLASRRGRAVEIPGARVESVAVDAGDTNQMEALFERLKAIGPLAGVYHAAGIATGPVAEVFRAKVAGARILDQLTRGDDLEAFVLVSSIASVWGSRGLGPYAAANAFLDALASRRRAEGLPALSVNWGPWAQGGMNSPEANRELARLGIEEIATEPALDTLGDLLGSRAARAVVARVEWPRLVPVLSHERSRPFFELVAPALSLGERLLRTAPSERQGVLATHLEALLARILGRGSIERDRGLRELGLDSIMAVEAASALSTDLGLEVPATAAFNHPTVEALAAHLLEEIYGRKAPAAPKAAPRAAEERIAVVGIGCRFPGGAGGPDAYWDLLVRGADAIGEVPGDRWDAAEIYDPDPERPGRTYVTKGGFLDQVDRFEPSFFGISPREATRMDPQQRILLEVAWEALEHAGISPDEVRGFRAGVFVGITTNDFARVLERAGAEAIDAYAASGNALNVAAGRLSYFFGLVGPSLVVDTACSSSLSSVHLAAESLRRGECSLALAGGVNLILVPDGTIATSKARMLSPEGRCKTFDASADGYVRSEGCGLAVLEPLPAALAAGHRVIAVLAGSAMGQDGASSGLTVPNGPAQQAVIRAALERAGVSPADVGYLECHGTGTSLGDPIEVEAAWAVYGEGRPRERPLALGSVKTNIGHLESAAGIAGFLKTALVLERGLVPPSLHFERPNPHIAWASMNAFVPTAPTPWREGTPRVAAVSAFGMSGTNVHAVLEAAPPRPEPPGPRSAPFVLSARTPESLRELARRFQTFLRDDHDLPAICHTLLAGRRRFEHRLVLAPSSFPELRDGLAAFLDGRLAPSEAGIPDPDPRPIPRVALPSYPWRRDRCWPKPAPAGPLVGRRIASPAIHDSVFEARFARTDPRHVIEDHRVFGRITVAGAMLVAIGLSLGRELFGERPYALEDLSLLQVLALAEDEVRFVQTVYRPAGGSFEIHSASEADPSAWVLHATGRSLALVGESAPPIDLESARSRCRDASSGADFYETFWRLGYHLGPSFRWMGPTWRGEGESLGRLVRPEAIEGEERYVLHPGLLDFAFQMLGVALEDFGERDLMAVPFKFRRIRLLGRTEGAAWATARVARTGDGRTTGPAGDLALCDETGRVLADVQGFETRIADPEVLGRMADYAREDGFHEIAWEEAPASGSLDRGPWLVLAERGGVGRALAERLADRGREVWLDPALANRASRVVDLRALDATGPASAASVLGPALETARAMASGKLWLVTRGVQGEPDERALGGSVLWGLGPTVQIERPEIAPRRLDLDPADRDPAATILAELAAGDDAPAVRYASGVREIARLVRRNRHAAERPIAIRRDRSYLVTGGLGALGLPVGRWLAGRGAGKVVLLSRRAPDEAARRALAAMPGEVVAANADVSDAASVEEIVHSLPDLAGVVHAAGVLDDGVLAEQDAARASRVLAPKATGAWNLHRATEALELDFFVLFSSASALVGSPGQSTYAAANAFLGALARFRRARRLPAVAIDWGPWAGDGMAARSPSFRRRVEAQGIGFLSPERGLAILGGLLGAEAAEVAVLPPAPRAPAAAPVESGRLRREVESARPEERRRTILGRLESELREVLGIYSDRPVPARQGFLEMGMDSLMAVELRNRLQRELEIPLPATLGMDHPDLESLADFLLGQIAPEDLQALSEPELEAILARELEALAAEESQ